MSGGDPELRPWRTTDAEALVAVADDEAVARYTSRRFPSPYTPDDARRWLAAAAAESPARNLAIVVDGRVAGGIGCHPYAGESRGTAMLGYWLGRAYWGRGIATAAVRAFVPYAFATFALRRLEAEVFAPNVASARLLARLGFELEGRRRAAVVDRYDTVHDVLLFARLAPLNQAGKEE